MDVLRRTRRNAYTVRGVGPNVTIERLAEVHAGARPYQISNPRLNRSNFFQRLSSLSSRACNGAKAGAFAYHASGSKIGSSASRVKGLLFNQVVQPSIAPCPREMTGTAPAFSMHWRSQTNSWLI
jgi:hypothetical protein